MVPSCGPQVYGLIEADDAEQVALTEVSDIS